LHLKVILKQPQFVHSSPSTPKTPSTPTTPGGTARKGGPMFSFTDPTLAKKAASVKENLLIWAQMKTKEYEVAIADVKFFFFDF
jgi:hypothetical protein